MELTIYNPEIVVKEIRTSDGKLAGYSLLVAGASRTETIKISMYGNVEEVGKVFFDKPDEVSYG